MNGKGAMMASWAKVRASVPKMACINGRYTMAAANASAAAMPASKGRLVSTPTERSDA